MSIVVVNVSQTLAPVPSTYQKKGAILSQGGTTLAANVTALLRQLSDLTSILKGALAITTVTWSGSVVTATTAAPHGIPNTAQVELTIAGVTPAGYNGTFLCTSTGASTFTYPLASNPGAQTVAGVYTPEDVAELTAQATTFFAQGGSQAVSVLELGIGSTAEGVTALAAYITANTVKGIGPFCAYLPPAEWGSEPTFPTFAATLTSLTAKTYFFTTMTTDNYTSFPNTTKSVLGMVEAPGTPSTEFSHAADFFIALNYAPSSTNKVTPLDNSEMFGVTPYPYPNNNTVVGQLLAANVNIVDTGAEGGLTNLILNAGTTMDGKDYTYWYSVDWVQINSQQAVAAAVINGSNNPQAPLYYNQQGINTLQAVINGVMKQGVNFGLVLGATVQVQMDPAAFVLAVNNGQFAGQTAINAQDFLSYSIANPNDYGNGLYSGFQIAYTPDRGFKQIIIAVNVTNFVAA